MHRHDAETTARELGNESRGESRGSRRNWWISNAEEIVVEEKKGKSDLGVDEAKDMEVKIN